MFLRQVFFIVSITIALASSASRAADDLPTWPDLSTDAGVQGGGDDDAALVVGVGDYYNLPAIAGAVDNATAWQQWLLRSRKVRPDRVVLLTDREATKGKIEKNLRALAKDVGTQGTLWFVFVGHGAPSASGDDGLLLGVDTDADADSVAERGVPQTTVLSLVGAGRQAHSVVVFDACFSGKTGDGAKTLVPGLQATIPTRRTTSSTTTILAASDSFAGPIPGAGRPAFSYLLLGALRGWADDDGDRNVSLDEAYAFSRGTIQALFKSADRLPRTSGPEVVLAKNVREAKPDMAALVAGRCPNDSRWNGRTCKALPKVKCPAGTSWNGEACVSDCPAGTRWDGEGCVAQQVHCPQGTTWDGRACVGACPKGARWNGSACEGQRVASLPVQEPASTEQPARGRRLPDDDEEEDGKDQKRAPTRRFAGEIQTEQNTGLTWVWMPPSTGFSFGCEPHDGACDAIEKPARRESVNGFWLLKTEVTVAAYDACVAAGRCPRVGHGTSDEELRCNSQGERSRHPMNCLTYGNAEAFCRFIGGRLPSAVEWEYAAKSGSSRVYPWREERFSARRSNYCGKKCSAAFSLDGISAYFLNDDDGFSATSPVGYFPFGATSWGLEDMAGNVWEWTSTNGPRRTKEVRGGSWNAMPAALRASKRSFTLPNSRLSDLGFRCAR